MQKMKVLVEFRRNMAEFFEKHYEPLTLQSKTRLIHPVGYYMTQVVFKFIHGRSIDVNLPTRSRQ